MLATTIGVAQEAEENKVTVSVRNAKIRDVLVMLAKQYDINMVPDETVEGKVTVNLKELKLKQALETLTMAYGYQFEKVNPNTYIVSKKKFDPSFEVTVKDKKLTLHVTNENIRSVLKEIARKADLNIVMDDSVSGKVSVDLNDVPLQKGLMSFLEVKGYSLSEKNGIYKVFEAGKKSGNNNLNISILDNKISIDVKQANIAEVLRTISELTEQDMVLFEGVRGRIDLKLEKASLEKAIQVVLSGTRYTYRKINGIYYIGSKKPNKPGSALFTTTELIYLDYINAEKFPKMLPNSFPAGNIKIIKEQNAILATGTQNQMKTLKKYVKKVDREVPEIVVEALIVEISHSQNKNPTAKLGMNYKDDDETTLLDTALGKLTYKSVLELPEDFYVKLQSLVSKGKATVKARPNVTTLNGQEAEINVETVQYYKSVTTDSDGNEETTYESINAGVTLSVTPWVSKAGEISLKLNPSVSNISGAAAEGPPEISKRQVNTTVRVKNGESIVLGGLIQDVGSDSQEQVPILGDIPLIGSFFSSSKKNINQTELVIYITPRVLKDGEKEANIDKQEIIDKANEELEKID